MSIFNLKNELSCQTFKLEKYTVNLNSGSPADK